MVVDALSRKSSHSMNILIASSELKKEVERFGLEFVDSPEMKAVCYALSVQPSIFEEIKLRQQRDVFLQDIWSQL